jgi:hypothetical protein
MTPDPYRATAKGNNPNNPQSWNKYAYTLGDPVNFGDPAGLDTCPAGSYDTCVDVFGTTVDFDPSTITGLSTGGAYNNAGASHYQALVNSLPIRNLALAYQFAVKQGDVSDCDALAAFAANLAQNTNDPNIFVEDFSVLVPSAGATSFFIETSSYPVALNTGQASGYLSQYQNTLPDNPTTGWNGDQGHHFAAFFELGYEYSVAGLSPGSLAAFALEYIQGMDSGVMNVGDVNLGEAAAQIGAALASKQISLSQVAGKIQGLCSK